MAGSKSNEYAGGAALGILAGFAALFFLWKYILTIVAVVIGGAVLLAVCGLRSKPAK